MFFHTFEHHLFKRHMLIMKTFYTILLMSLFSFFSNAQTVEPNVPVYDINLTSIKGDQISLSDYKGKYILFVNVASKCGFTGQYDGLQNLYDTYKDNLVVIGLPCNQFGEQEPGNAEEIQSFCRVNYGVEFPISEKLDVKGENQHALYTWLTQKSENGKMDTKVKWNFQKYLIDPEGRLVDVFYSMTKPMSDKITKHLK